MITYTGKNDTAEKYNLKYANTETYIMIAFFQASVSCTIPKKVVLL